MQKLTINDILEATGGRLLSGSAEAELDDITTDSRKAGEGVLFIPLIGDKFDGHEFIKAAFDMGTSAVLTQKETELLIDKTIILVENTLKAFRDIAEFYKKKYKIPTVAITGSVGKTTTKDMLYAALSEKYCTIKTPNNFNNEIGVPITVLMQEKEHEAAVIEMGMNHFGEITRLAKIGRPDAAVITNIGMSHIENFGSREGILKAKMEITTFFTPENTLIINDDDDMLQSVEDTNKYKIMRFGIDSERADITAKDILNLGLDGVEFTVVYDGAEYRARVSQPGRHNVYNALAAICTGLVFGIDVEKSIAGIKSCEYTSQRMEIEKHGGIEIINDCYNASPASIKAALAIMPFSVKNRKVAVLGDVLEMGGFAKDAHYQLGKDVIKNGVDLLITAGENAREIARGANDEGMMNTVSFDKTLGAMQYVKEAVRDGDCVLVKASHGMHFEKIVAAIKEI